MTHPKSYWISLIVFFLIIASAILFAWYSWNADFEIDSQAGVWQKMNFRKEKEEVDIDNSDWQTYRNEEYGFEFQYPSTWKSLEANESLLSRKDFDETPEFQVIEYDKLGGKTFNLYFDDLLCKEADKKLKSCYFNLQVDYYSKDKPNILNCLEGSCIAFSVIDKRKLIEKSSNIKIADIEGMVSDRIDPWQSVHRSLSFATDQYLFNFYASLVPVRDGNYNFGSFANTLAEQDLFIEKLLDMNPNTSNISELKIFLKNIDQILSTFKFIDPNDTSDWQTYRNEEYGFEFQYPENWQIKNEKNEWGEVTSNFYDENDDNIGYMRCPVVARGLEGLIFTKNLDKNFNNNKGEYTARYEIFCSPDSSEKKCMDEKRSIMIIINKIDSNTKTCEFNISTDTQGQGEKMDSILTEIFESIR